MTKEQNQERHPEDEKNLLEWTVFFISLLLIVGILGYLVYQASVFEEGSPDLQVNFVHDPSSHSPYRYLLKIENDGQETAEEVQIEMVLERGGEELEAAALTLPYVPKQSAREGWVVLSKNPLEADTLYVRVVGYKRP